MTSYSPDSSGRQSGDSSPGTPSPSYVLVVDDEAVVREFLSRCLERGGYRVRQAAGAAEALEVMAADPASAVLCDIRMPGENGLWLAAQLRARWPETPVVMATALDDTETVRQTRQIGAADYISKPVRPERLLEVIRRVIAGREAPPVSDIIALPSAELPSETGTKIEAEYTLESPVRCSACGERITTLTAVRLIRAQVNFTSTLPRRGRVLACPLCLAIVPAELTNF